MATSTISPQKSIECANTRKTLNVETAVNSLDGAIVDIQEALIALENVLEPIISDKRPCGDTCCDRSKGESEVAERILVNVDGANYLARQLRDLIARL